MAAQQIAIDGDLHLERVPDDSSALDGRYDVYQVSLRNLLRLSYEQRDREVVEYQAGCKVDDGRRRLRSYILDAALDYLVARLHSLASLSRVGDHPFVSHL